MVFLMINWVVGALALLLLASIVPGFRITNYQSAILATGLVGLISSAIATMFKGITSQSGLAVSGSLLLFFDTFLLRLIALLFPGFTMRASYPAVAGAVLLAGLHILLLRILRMRESAVKSEQLMHS